MCTNAATPYNIVKCNNAEDRLGLSLRSSKLGQPRVILKQTLANLASFQYAASNRL